MRQNTERKLKTALFDLALIAVGLVVFAYFHHVRPTKLDAQAIVIARPTASPTLESAPDATDFPASTETPVQAAELTWREKFADKFTSGDVQWTASSYKSADISIEITGYDESGLSGYAGGDLYYFVADIYLADIECYRTYLAGGYYAKGVRDYPLTMASEAGAILAVTGDYYGTRDKGIVIRNGSAYRTETFKDVCTLFYDGTMETSSAEAYDVNDVISRGAYQAWSFGPALLDENGWALTQFNSDVTPKNPRCALGYYEPGHYCFVVVDGRADGYSEGLTLANLALLFQQLGCKAAYNLDGGQTAAMVFNGQLVNKPSDGGRKLSDIVYIDEVTAQ